MALTRLVVELALVDGISTGVRSLAGHLQKMGKEGEQAFKMINGAVTDLEAGLKSLSTARALKQSLVDPGVAAAATLEQAMANLEVNLDKSSLARMTAQLAEVEQNAARIAGPTKFDQAQSVQIHTDLVRAGLPLESVLGRGGAAEAVTQLASAEGLDAPSALSAVTTLGSIFGLKGSEYGSGADLLARAGAASNTNAAQLREALAQAPAAGALGLDPKETLASLGVMANMGIQGGSAGTALNAFLRSAANNDQKMKLGLFGADGSFSGVGTAAERLRSRTADMNDVQVQRFITKAFGDEGARFALALLKADQGGLEDVLSSIERARSLDEKVARLSATKLATDEALGGSMETLLATAFRPALDPLTRLNQRLNEGLGVAQERLQASPGLAQAVSYGAMGVAGAAGVYGLGRIARGGARGIAGLSQMGRLGALGGRAAGLAEAKALEAAAGVTPVAVVNWPTGLSSLGAVGGQAAAAGGASRLGMAVPVVGAAAAGLAVGSGINSVIKESPTADTLLQGGLASTLLYHPAFRAVGELVDRMSGSGLIDQARREREQAINLVVNVGRDGSVRTDDGGRGVLGRVMARLGGT